ncbi:MAG: hypothetical protein R2847_10760 [Bacteroidia bacterium]
MLKKIIMVIVLSAVTIHLPAQSKKAGKEPKLPHQPRKEYGFILEILFQIILVTPLSAKQKTQTVMM